MKSFMKAVLTLSLVLVISVIVALLYRNFQIQNEMGMRIALPSVSADIKIEHARYTETKDGRREWDIEAASAQYFKKANITVFDRVKVVFYSQGAVQYVLEGREGSLRNDSKDMDIRGDVVVTSMDGYRIATDSLHYTAAIKQISTKDKVVFTGPRITIEGIGFVADMVSERVSVLAHIRTILRDASI